MERGRAPRGARGRDVILATMEDTPKKDAFAWTPGTGVAMGVAIGAGIGVALDNIAIGIAIGVAIGAGLDGAGYAHRSEGKEK
jgi:hypothetical protein